MTGAVNMSRTDQATKTHCIHGHEYTPENTRVKKRKNGLTIRNCRTCELAAKKRYYLRNVETSERIAA